jgi:hypothetical protein
MIFQRKTHSEIAQKPKKHVEFGLRIQKIERESSDRSGILGEEFDLISGSDEIQFENTLIAMKNAMLHRKYFSAHEEIYS